ncbi:MAG: SdrD B-like domain-containing protein [Chloroflexota bacterium]
MKRQQTTAFSLMVIFFAVSFLLGGCGRRRAQPTPGGDVLTAVVQTLTAEAILQAGGAVTTSGTPQPAEMELPTPTATLEHKVRPGQGAPVVSAIFDTISGDTAQQGQTNQPLGGDYWLYNLYERPFNAQTQDIFFPDLDIRQAQMGHQDLWMYVTIELYGTRPETNALEATYGVEIDLDLDGRGDWLIEVTAPLENDWTVNGVRVWEDTDNDVGGEIACYADPPQPEEEDSYDNLVFDQGIGDDPDAAWARNLSGDPPRVQIAFKHSLINNDVYFMWGVWADQGVNEPQWFDYHDHFTHEEAGSPFSYLPTFPIKAIFEVDNTCRWTYGFEPDGDEPCLCAGALGTPEAPGEEGGEGGGKAGLAGVLWKDANRDSTRDVGEGIGGLTVTLKAGACPGGATVDTSVTDANGSYKFTGLDPGTYCVIPPAPFTWSPTNRQVTVDGGDFVDCLDFQFQ